LGESERVVWIGVDLGDLHSVSDINRPEVSECTFAIRALRSERTRNLNLSNSVCIMTSLKFAEGSAVAFIVSMASILSHAISIDSLRLKNRVSCIPA
jgi:hypothetical protein